MSSNALGNEGGLAADFDDLETALNNAYDGVETTTEDVDNDFGPLDAAAEPTAEPEIDTRTAAERARDEKGRFAPKDKAPAAETAPAAPEAPATENAAPEAPARPPHSFSPVARSVWDKDVLEPAEWAAVKNDISKREGEINKGLAKLADYKGLDRYADMAKQSGTTVAAAFEAYQRAEAKLGSNFAAGVQELCQHYRTHPAQLAAQLLNIHPQALAAALQGRAAPQGSQVAPQAQPAAAGQSAEAQRIARLEKVIESQFAERTAQERAKATSVVEEFFNDPQNRYAPNCEAEILELVSRDPDRHRDQRGALKRAYDKAVWLRDDVRDLLIKERTAAARPQTNAAAVARARASAKSVTGSPLPGASTTPARTSGGSLEADLMAAWDSMTPSA
jgi:hypothetical protein